MFDCFRGGLEREHVMQVGKKDSWCRESRLPSLTLHPAKLQDIP